MQLFISYRRSDTAGHARGLNEGLKDWIRREDLFFDQRSIDLAENFHDEIDAGIRSCRVMLVLMGPDWLTATNDKGQRRLHLPTDVVRQEIALALQLGKAVIGVRFDGAPLPTADDLPDDLKPLATRTMLPMGGREELYAASLQTLLQHIADAGVPLRKPLLVARDASSTLLVPPDSLPLLCDRAAQCEQIHDALESGVKHRAAARPLVCVLHGAVEERHDFLVERLHQRELPLQLARTPWARGLRCVDIPDRLPFRDATSFGNRLRSLLARELEIDAPDDAALLAGLRQRRLNLLVINFGWSASELKGQAGAALGHVRRWFETFPELPDTLAMVCLLVLKYDRPAQPPGFFGRLLGRGGNAAADELRQALAALQASQPPHWHVAEELPSIESADLNRWLDAARKALGRSLPIRVADLEAIVAEGPQPMERVHEELLRLVRQSLAAG